MRIYFLLIFTSIILSFSTAYFALNLEKNNFATPSEIKQIAEIQHTFHANVKPLGLLPLSSIYPTRDYIQLIYPSSIYPTSGIEEHRAFFSKDCYKIVDQISRKTFDKSEIWEDFRCNRITKLPTNFFLVPPMVHESGFSYAYFAALSGREPFSTSEWIKNNLNFFHVLELKNLPPQILFDVYEVLAQLESGDYLGIINGKNHIVSKDYYLLKINSKEELEYLIFDKTQFESFWKERSWFVKSFVEGDKCFYQDGNLCWKKDTRNVLELFRRSSIIIFLFSILVLIFVLIILYQKLKQQKHEEERKKHALRVLTHELRTPIANLLLRVELINKQSDIIPPGVLEDFLKVESDVYRLKRLAEKSSSYLQTHDKKTLLAFDYHQIDSINDFLLEIAENFKEKNVKFIFLEKDQSFSIDTYWLSVCLNNLIENAIVHGKAPVEVKASIEDNFLRLDVIDRGICNFKNLEEMFKSDRTGKNQKGLGLGLSIVCKIIREMNGKLVLNKFPTTFSIFVRNNK